MMSVEQAEYGDRFRKQEASETLEPRVRRKESWGQKRFRLVRRRLDTLKNAQSLDDLRHLPGRCHELTQDRQGQLSLDLDGPYRLIFEVANDPVPCRDDGGLDWRAVTAVRILGIEDTHA